jgi:hypothetical protein
MNDCAGKGQEQFTRPDQTKAEQKFYHGSQWDLKPGMTLLAKASRKLPDQTKPVSHHSLRTGAAENGTSRGNTRYWKLQPGSKFLKTADWRDLQCAVVLCRLCRIVKIL